MKSGMQFIFLADEFEIGRAFKLQFCDRINPLYSKICGFEDPKFFLTGCTDGNVGTIQTFINRRFNNAILRLGLNRLAQLSASHMRYKSYSMLVARKSRNLDGSHIFYIDNVKSELFAQKYKDLVISEEVIVTSPSSLARFNKIDLDNPIKIDIAGREPDLVTDLISYAKYSKIHNILISYKKELLGQSLLNPLYTDAQLVDKGLTRIVGGIASGYVLYRIQD